MVKCMDYEATLSQSYLLCHLSIIEPRESVSVSSSRTTVLLLRVTSAERGIECKALSAKGKREAVAAEWLQRARLAYPLLAVSPEGLIETF